MNYTDSALSCPTTDTKSRGSTITNIIQQYGAHVLTDAEFRKSQADGERFIISTSSSPKEWSDLARPDVYPASWLLVEQQAGCQMVVEAGSREAAFDQMIARAEKMGPTPVYALAVFGPVAFPYRCE